ncbi:MAG TPA: CAP domain-containing protein [Anaerolineales bacterium]|nr:CAP domain-containing protein [Anaerolineales bacterium]
MIVEILNLKKSRSRNLSRWFSFLLFSVLVCAVLLPTPSKAESLPRQTINTPSQLIDAVNNLRIANGLPALAVHSVLMQSSQSQADYMASVGYATHERPGGISFTQQLLSLGFPLAGDLSLGGFRAENVIQSSNPLVWNGVPPAWQDSQHMNTMLSQNFTHIGAGISQGPSGYFYALDCAAATGSGEMQDGVTTLLTSVPGGAQAGVSQYMVPVMLSTANANGDVFHKVQYGQTLWSIAIEYGTTIKAIQALNGLGEDLVVYQGQELLVLKGVTPPPAATPTMVQVMETPTSAELITTEMPIPPVTPTSIPQVVTAPATDMPVEEEGSSSNSSGLLVGILVVAALVGGGVAVWLIRDPN